MFEMKNLQAIKSIGDLFVFIYMFIKEIKDVVIFFYINTFIENNNNNNK